MSKNVCVVQKNYHTIIKMYWTNKNVSTYIWKMFNTYTDNNSKHVFEKMLAMYKKNVSDIYEKWTNLYEESRHRTCILRKC